MTLIESTQLRFSERYVDSLDGCLYTEDDKKFYHLYCCVACESGQVAGSDSCIDCQEGHKCPSTQPVSLNGPCSPGTFQPKTKQTTCIDCPKGKECQDQGLTEFKECPLGYNCQE